MLRLSIFGTFRVADALGNEILVKSRKSRALLAYLALPPGKPRSREQIMALLWSNRGDQQARSSLRQALSGLRKDLGEQGRPALRVTDESLMLDSAQVVVEPALQGDLLLDGLHLTDPAFEEWLRDERLRREDSQVTDPQLKTPPLPDKPSIAVLPFTNMSGDPEQEYFSDGITEDIITELSRLPTLFVIARNSSFVFKGKAVDVAEIGRKLGVQYVVEGSVRKAGPRVRITAQLAETTSGKHIWAERYDRQLGDIFAVQDELVEMIASNLGRSLRDAAFDRVRRQPAGSLSAYEHLLRGRAAWWRSESTKAFAHVERALKADPDYAAAHAWLATQYTYDQFKGELDMTIDERAERARQHAHMALRLDDRDPFLHMAVSMVFCFTMGGDQARALRHSDIAISLNPHDYECMYCRAYVLMANDRCREALDWLGRARRLSPIAAYLLSEAYFDVFSKMGEHEKALETIGGQDYLPVNMYLHVALANAHLGRWDKARSWVRKFERERPAHFDIRAYLRFVAGTPLSDMTHRDVVSLLRQADLHVPD